MTRQVLFLFLALLVVVGQTLAFAPSSTLPLSPRTAESSTTALSAIRRRAAFSWLKKAVLTGVGISTASKLEQKAALAADEEGGKIVTLTVDNLDGEAGKTGTIKIQLQPSWAPRGVERFEVRFWVVSLAFPCCKQIIVHIVSHIFSIFTWPLAATNPSWILGRLPHLSCHSGLYCAIWHCGRSGPASQVAWTNSQG